ncbi:MAG: hypothetical protein QQN63_04590 [Nitrosopumilus sp.]
MKIFYSVQNCGDGSAYPWFFTTEELSEWDQEHMEDGWGEMCVGDLEIGPGPCPEAMDAVSYWLRMIDEGHEIWDLRDEYLEKFFPDGLPHFHVAIIDKNFYSINVNNIQKGKGFQHPGLTSEVKRSKFQDKLNKK